MTGFAYRHSGGGVDEIGHLVMRALVYLLTYRIFGHAPLIVIVVVLGVVFFALRWRRRNRASLPRNRRSRR